MSTTGDKVLWKRLGFMCWEATAYCKTCDAPVAIVVRWTRRGAECAAWEYLMAHMGCCRGRV